MDERPNQGMDQPHHGHRDEEMDGAQRFYVEMTQTFPAQEVDVLYWEGNVRDLLAGSPLAAYYERPYATRLTKSEAEQVVRRLSLVNKEIIDQGWQSYKIVPADDIKIVPSDD